MSDCIYVLWYWINLLNMFKIAPEESCTGCGACSYICPKSCITMKESGTKGLLPELDVTDCIDCGLCAKKCPVNSPIEKDSPIEVFASWHKNPDLRRECASSGTATAMYERALDLGWLIAGAVSINALDVEMQLHNDVSAIPLFKNSKYIFSSCEKLYPQIKKALAENRHILFIGLPCQVAAIRNLFGKNRDKMVLVDLVCHGTNPKEYLRQHINHIRKVNSSDVDKVVFREGNKFLIKMLDKMGNVVYRESSWYKDMYQYGYHRGIFYRHNCYKCNYASGKRVSDITLKDYWGLGQCSPVGYPTERVSAVLINSTRGRSFFQGCVVSDKIVAHKRPLDEPGRGDPQLCHPTLVTSEKKVFDKLMATNGNDFERAMAPIARYSFYRDKLRTTYYALKVKIYHFIIDKLK